MKCHKRLPVIQFRNSHTGRNNHKHAGAVTWVRCHYQRLFLVYYLKKKQAKKTDGLPCRWFYDIHISQSFYFTDRRAKKNNNKIRATWWNLRANHEPKHTHTNTNKKHQSWSGGRGPAPLTGCLQTDRKTLILTRLWTRHPYGVQLKHNCAYEHATHPPGGRSPITETGEVSSFFLFFLKTSSSQAGISRGPTVSVPVWRHLWDVV